MSRSVKVVVSERHQQRPSPMAPRYAGNVAVWPTAEPLLCSAEAKIQALPGEEGRKVAASNSER